MTTRPLATSVRVEADGRPAPKGSRTYARTKTGRAYTFPASKFEKPWVDAVKRATELQMRHHTLTPPYAVDLSLRIIASKRPKHAWPSQHDLDKLARAVIDGLVQGGAIDDDRNVVELQARKRFIEADEQPGVIAYVTSLTE